MKARRRDSRDEADDEVARRKHDSAGAVFPDVFKSELELAIGAKLEAVLSKRSGGKPAWSPEAATRRAAAA